MKNVLLVILLVTFIGLSVLLIKTYIDIRNAKGYINFVTDSANNVLLKLTEINKSLNEFEFNENGENDLTDIESKLSGLKESYNNISNLKTNYKIPYGAEEVNNEFNNYLDSLDDLVKSHEELVISVKNLEKKEDFEIKLEQYINYSNEVQMKSETLEEKLSEYVQNYNKFDFNTLINGIKFI